MENHVNATRPYRRYDETFKRHAVELTLREKRTVKSVANELGVSLARLYEWRKDYGPKPSGQGSTAPARTLEEVEEENRRLREEVLRMRERETVLKKSLGILSETPERGMPRSKR